MNFVSDPGYRRVSGEASHVSRLVLIMTHVAYSLRTVQVTTVTADDSESPDEGGHAVISNDEATDDDEASDDEATAPVTELRSRRDGDDFRGIGYVRADRHERWFVKRMHWTAVNHRWFGRWMLCPAGGCLSVTLACAHCRASLRFPYLFMY